MSRGAGQYHSLLVVLLAVSVVLLLCNFPGGANGAGEESQLKVGRSIDIFTRFGYLSLSMKVVPRNDSDWIFREPTINVFTDVDQYSYQADRTPKKPKKVFDGDFHMEFCDNLRQLVQAYFRDFNFEKLDKPWRAFTSSWSIDHMSRNLGINSSFIQKDHCFVLVRLSRFRDSVKLLRTPSELNLVDEVQNEIDEVQNGDVSSVMNFIKKYGSHYIQSYVTGNSLYQVFVYNKTKYNQIKDRLKNQGISQISEQELNQYFSPWYAEHIGSIKVASGNKTVETWASSSLRHTYYIFTYPSLLKTKGDSRLLTKLNNLLKNEAILEIDMKSLSPIFRDANKKKWFEEVLDNSLKLWESNL